jgi:hypothetical protein
MKRSGQLAERQRKLDEWRREREASQSALQKDGSHARFGSADFLGCLLLIVVVCRLDAPLFLAGIETMQPFGSGAGGANESALSLDEAAARQLADR